MFVHSCVSTKEDRPGVGVTGASELYDKGMGNGTQIHCKNNMLLLQSQGFFLLNYFSQVFVTTWKVWIYRCAISRSLAWHTESSCWGNSLMDIPPMDYRVLLFPLLKSFTIASGFVVLHLSFSNKSSKCFFLHASISSRRLRSFRAQAELEPCKSAALLTSDSRSQPPKQHYCMDVCNGPLVCNSVSGIFDFLPLPFLVL